MSTPPRRSVGLRCRRIPLTLSFGVISLILTVGLGVMLAGRIERTINVRSVDSLKKTTATAAALTANMILTNVSPQGGKPMTVAERLAQSHLVDAASKVLLANSDIVGAEAALPNGMVFGGAGAGTLGTMLPLDAGFRDALQGRSGIRILRLQDRLTGNSENSVIERRMLRANGDLLVIDQGIRTSPAASVSAVVRTYATMRPSARAAASDIRRTVIAMAWGLLIFWGVLFRLVVGTSRSLTRKSADNVFLATHDTLTLLPNRALLRRRVDRAIAASRHSGRHVALLVIDLDHLKEINGTLGHRYGDALLKAVGPRLGEQLRASDTVARLGGDEFGVLLPDLRSPAEAVAVAQKLVTLLQQPFPIEGEAVDVGCSVGVATTPDHGQDFDELLQHTDVAKHIAKRDSLGVAVYAAGLDLNSPSRLALLGELRRAADQPEQIVLYYQPKASLPSGAITGVEALVRWQHPQHGLLLPDRFIPLAERSGIIRPLTWCILRKALEENRRWASDGLLLQVAVNISARSLLDVAFPDDVVRMLQEIGVPADRLELELTESAVMTNPDRALTILRKLAAGGIRLSIDDFGTGYSSMAYLKRLPVQEIKIDRTFVTDMARDANDAAIVRSSMELARNLNLDVVAEGVESAEVWDQLAVLGCTSVQGYFLSKPLPSAEFRSWLATYSQWRQAAHPTGGTKLRGSEGPATLPGPRAGGHDGSTGSRLAADDGGGTHARSAPRRL